MPAAREGHAYMPVIASSTDSIPVSTALLLLLLILFVGYHVVSVWQIRRRAAKQEELFRIIAENAADMIALVDVKGHRLYNSPAYKRILGYSPAELGETSALEQIHPDDRFKVLEAGRDARSSGVGKPLQYRIRHKDASWRILESTASAIRNARGEVEKLVIINRDITDRKRAEEELAHNSLHDPLTGLPNRRLFLDRLRRAAQRARRHPDYKYAVLFVDIDGFKVFNDTMGHAAGDQFIVEIGQRLSSCLRSDDTIARPKGNLPLDDAILSRLGGDEFTILVEGIGDASDAMRVAKRMQDAIAKPFLAEAREIFVSASVGIALSTPPTDAASGETAEEDLLRDADTAMHRAKHLGRSRCEIFDTAMHTRAVNQLQLETDLRKAVEQRQFQAYYQPIFDLNTGRIVNFEALLRWSHPAEGIVLPARFIHTLEATGLIVPIGRWMLDEACRQAKLWQSRYPLHSALGISVNVSAKQFAHPALVSDVQCAIRDSGLDPSCLHLEITESMAMADANLTASVLAQLRHIGVRITVDDFGTGHSSLGRLRVFPVDTLKIDRSFVETMLADRSSLDIIRLVIALAHSMDLQLTAEGIEIASQANHLKDLGCEFGQGYLFSKPVEAKAAEELLASPLRLGGIIGIPESRVVTAANS